MMVKVLVWDDKAKEWVEKYVDKGPGKGRPHGSPLGVPMAERGVAPPRHTAGPSGGS